ncbi:hypothetical protein AN1V17_09470 [Vallitalea sediminicola]
MSKKVKIVLFFVAIIIIFYYYNSNKNRVIYYAPNSDQVKQFIERKKILPLDIENTKEYSIILFENNSLQGYYLLYTDLNDRLYEKYVSGIYNDTNKNKISISGMESGYAFITIIITDEKIYNKASKVVVQLNNQKNIEEKIESKGIIIMMGEDNQWNVINIYDQDGNLLYTQKR